MTIVLEDPDGAEIDAWLRAADPVDPAALHGAVGSAAAASLLDAITGSASPNWLRAHRRLTLTGVVGAAAAAAIAVPLALTVAHPSSGPSAYAAPLVRFAENSPRLLVGADGWRVSSADEEDAQNGEMTFADGPASLSVFWVPGAHGKDSDKVELTHLGFATIDGQPAWVGTYGRGDFEAIWSVGQQTREARGVFATKSAFLAIARTLHRVDVDTWLGAMPASVVDPSARASVVDEMLADIPQPNGFSDRSLLHSNLVLQRYQLGAAVTGAVSCAWVHQWTHGNAAQRAQASAAMATSHHWKVLKQMESQGAYPSVLWMIADHMNGAPLAMPSGETFEQWTRSALDC
jgi:hypothetical protein